MIPIAFFFGGGRRTDQTAGRQEGLVGAMTVAWDDQFKRNNIMWKVPRNIRMNDNIVVREDEIAVFYRDGKVLAYLDRPDRYALTSQNAPILGRLIQALSGVVQQAEVYYLQKRIFDGKFGSKEPFLFTDPDFDMIQLRAFGEFRYKIGDAETFINQFVGTFGAATSAEVEDRIKDELMKQLNVTLGKMKAGGLRVVDLAASLNDIEQGVLANARPHFKTIGVEIVQMAGMNIPLPESVKAALEKMASAKVLGRANTAAYQQFAVADALRDAAQNPSGGAAGIGLGLGAGIGMGAAMGSQVPGMMQPAAQQQVKACPKCGANNPVNMKFCGTCGADTTAVGKPCVKCGKPVAPGLKFCGECGSAQTVKCPDGHEAPGNMKFCPECGKAIQG
ncbi:MAG TPA: SPFH domain-containing protein [Thermoplasmata archaeon]|nr:SPFH domain-containing protein [Thermoplasmata archaeon]